MSATPRLSPYMDVFVHSRDFTIYAQWSSSIFSTVLFRFFLSRCISFVVVAIKKQNAKHATHANSYMEKRVHVACDCIYDLSILLC